MRTFDQPVTATLSWGDWVDIQSALAHLSRRSDRQDKYLALWQKLHDATDEDWRK